MRVFRGLQLGDRIETQVCQHHGRRDPNPSRFLGPWCKASGRARVTAGKHQMQNSGMVRRVSGRTHGFRALPPCTAESGEHLHAFSGPDYCPGGI